MLTLAISKGRLLTETLPLLAACGCAPIENAEKSRALILPTENPQVRLLIVRAQDAPTYVACGVADAGVVGGDVIAETPSDDIYQPLTLPIGKCRLVVASRADSVAGKTEKTEKKNKQQRQITVATKYVNLARQYFNEQGIHCNIIKLYGSLELAPLVGMADIIVDLAESGNTLQANGLVETTVIRQISAMFITNRVATRRKPLLSALQQQLKDTIDNAAH